MTFIHLVAPKRAVGSYMSAMPSTTARPTGIFKVSFNALCPAKSYIQLTAVIGILFLCCDKHRLAVAWSCPIPCSHKATVWSTCMQQLV